MKALTKDVFAPMTLLLATVFIPVLAQADANKPTPKRDVRPVLKITKAGAGNATITSSPAGIDCGALCQARFKTQSHVTLTAAAAPGSAFKGWSGDCKGTAPTCTVMLKKAQNITALTALLPITLNIAKTGLGTGTVTSSPAGIDCGAVCSTAFPATVRAPDDHGEKASQKKPGPDHKQYNDSRAAKPAVLVTLTAVPTAGSSFEGWSGACTGTAATCTVMMDQTQNVSADFAPAFKTLSLAKTGSGSGTVTSSPAGIDCGQTCSFGFDANGTVTLTASPATGSSFQGWLGACTGTANTCTVTLSQVQHLYASFLAPSTTTYHYDANGNLTQVTDPLGNNRQIEYDSLNQPVRQLEPHPAVTGGTLGQIDTAYDNLGQIIQVTDPRNLATEYQVDNLGNVLSQTSPDTGITQNTYDDAGNLLTRTDARGKTASYRYDSQNRLTQILYDDQTVTALWDQCANGIGRLCNLANAGINLSFSYDVHGRITGKSQTVDAVTLTSRHRYNASGQRQQTTTPSGQTIGYEWLNDRLETVTVNGEALITQIVYEADGQIGGWTWGNGTTSERLYDLAGRPVAISLGFDAQSLLPSQRHLSYDASGRITGIIDDNDANLDQSYTYDNLDRLIRQQQGAFTLNQFDYDYDLSGNRTSKIVNHSVTESHGVDAGSNRLLQKTGAQTVNYNYDAAGNLLSDGALRYGYNAQGRRSSATATNLNAAYRYNAFGQRVSKTVNGITTLYAYDDQGHLSGEYEGNGQLIQEIIWLGDLPIAVLKPSATPGVLVDVFYIHSDHLNTPRNITRPSDNSVLWRWEAEAFGDSLPNENPSHQGDFTFNLRFPGQYFDHETGLHYNVFRDYDPKQGRYLQSDPIGLAGGINTYAYVNGNPVSFTDILGLKPGDPFSTMDDAALDALDYVYDQYPTSPNEYAGTIYRGNDGKYYSTDPLQGGDHSSTPSYPKFPIQPIARYHTHGQCTQSYAEDEFSDGYRQDKWVADLWQTPSYLGTPGGYRKRYDPDPNRKGKGPVTTLRDGCNCPGEGNK